MPTHGSTLHSAGRCRPCAWFWKPSGCTNGQECGHCHLCPPGVRKSRRKARAAGQTGPEVSPSLPAVESSPCFSERTPFSVADFSTAAGSGSERSTPAAGSATLSQDDSPSSADEEDGVMRQLRFPPGISMQADGSSALHGEGNCRPCAWFWKAVGCQNAEGCGFCHTCPAGEVKARKKQREAQKRGSGPAPAAPPVAAAC